MFCSFTVMYKLWLYINLCCLGHYVYFQSENSYRSSILENYYPISLLILSFPHSHSSLLLEFLWDVFWSLQYHYLSLRFSPQIFFFKFIYFEGEGESRSRGGAERESQAGSTISAQSPTWGSISQTIRSRPEPKSTAGCLTNWAMQVSLPPDLYVVIDPRLFPMIYILKFNKFIFSYV